MVLKEKDVNWDNKDGHSHDLSSLKQFYSNFQQVYQVEEDSQIRKQSEFVGRCRPRDDSWKKFVNSVKDCDALTARNKVFNFYKGTFLFLCFAVSVISC